MPRLRVHHLVEVELNEAKAWYRDRSPLAEVNFVDSFGRALRRIESHPTAHAPWRSIFRRARIAHFPYLILFHANRRLTSVLALVHQRREPTRVLKTLRHRLARFA